MRGKTVLTVVVLSMIVLGLAVGASARQRIQMQAIADNLGSNELFLWVHSDHAATIIAKGEVCGRIPFNPAAYQNKETYTLEFFGPIIEELHKHDVNVFISSIDRILFHFDSKVEEEDRNATTDIFRRRTEVYTTGCCTEERNYCCCTSSIEPWIVQVPDASAVIDLHKLSSGGVENIDVVVASDSSRREEPLLGWLEDRTAPKDFHKLSITFSDDERLVDLSGYDSSWKPGKDSIVILVVSFDYSGEKEIKEVRQAVEERVLKVVEGARLVVYFEFANSDMATSAQDFSLEVFEQVELGAVSVPVAGEPADTVKGLVIDLQGLLSREKVTVSDIADSLTRWGLAIYPLS